MEAYDDLILIFIACLSAFAFSMLIAPPVIKRMGMLKAGQPILKYLEHHNAKSGTPTMGGLIFIIPTVFITLALAYNRISLVAVTVTAGYGILGFLDDFIKVRLKRNEGLKPYQKVMGQLGIAVIASLFAYGSGEIGSAVKIPFSTSEINLGMWVVPLSVFLFVAVTNSVNLTDGIDGLSGSSGAIATAATSAAAFFYYSEAAHYGLTAEAEGLFSLALFSGVSACSLLGFLWNNVHPSKIFMGDTGSLALGGSIAAATVFMRNPLLAGIVCVVYAWSSVSVILQVVYFRLTKKQKRLFGMSPFHHHLELKGYSETQITAFYTVITAAAALVGLISVIMNLN
ncbi:MAG: phospho-N-acetylmuramoyl-pentapeptide-transferase [Clostridiales bacterium]|jgi:phospho-N-acetylmuramoyl-pentapeptide-transferase|nr:phospho-N-acetylmuramoyl-pentapeptide-transferase [Clostridiales bacterium]